MMAGYFASENSSPLHADNCAHLCDPAYQIPEVQTEDTKVAYIDCSAASK